MDNPQPGDNTNEMDICLAYIDGYASGLAEGNHSICASKATLGTMARVYVLYMESIYAHGCTQECWPI